MWLKQIEDPDFPHMTNIYDNNGKFLACVPKDSANLACNSRMMYDLLQRIYYHHTGERTGSRKYNYKKENQADIISDIFQIL